MHLEKKGIRILGIAESFMPSDILSVLAGIVMRRDLIIDGMIFGNTTVRGNDATEAIISMFKKINRNDINCILSRGTIISVLNIIDGKELYDTLKVPVVIVSELEKKGLKESSLHKFENGLTKVRLYSKVKERTDVKLKTGKYVQLRSWGMSIREASLLVNSVTLQGSKPEPIRIARLAARAFRSNLYKRES